MARIVNKLNLNKTPQLVEDNSIIFAKNIKLSKNGIIGKDSGIKDLGFNEALFVAKVTQAIQLKTNKLSNLRSDLYRCSIDVGKVNKMSEIDIRNSEFTPSLIPANAVSINSKPMINSEKAYEDFTNTAKTLNTDETIYSEQLSTFFDGAVIVGVIPYNTCFYVFWANLTVYSYNVEHGTNNLAFLITKYDETIGSVDFEYTGWTWSGGEITGNVIVNLNGDIILNIAEYVNDDVLVPFKSINLNKASYKDNESIYTQTPKVPIVNLKCIKKFTWQIPNGVYQFFIRFKIRKGIYTSWIPCTDELFAGNANKVNTSQGTVKYVDTSKDASESFVFQVEQIYNNSKLDTFQLGFIVSHDDSSYCKIWKEFSIGQSMIYFDYKEEEGVDEDTDIMLSPIFDLYNVKNVVEFKTKLYVSNYHETNFNPNFTDIATKVSVELKTKDIDSELDIQTKYPIVKEDLNTNDGVKSVVTSINNELIHNIIKHFFDNNLFFLFPFNFPIGTPIEDIRVWMDNAYKFKFDSSWNGIDCSVIDTIAVIRPFPSYHYWGNLNLIIEYYDSNSELKELAKGSLATFEDDAIISIDNTPLDIFINHFNNIDIDTNLIHDTYDARIGNLTPYGSTNKYRFTLELKSYRGNPEHTSIIAGPKNYISHDVIFSPNFIISINTITSDKFYKTLLPLQKYKFYIHFIKDNGEITNGFQVGDEVQAPIAIKSIIYPKFTFNENFVIPKGYCGFFFSIAHTGNKIVHVTNIHTNTAYDSKSLGDAPEVDSMLSMYSSKFKVTLIPDDYTSSTPVSDLSEEEALYAASGNGIDPHTFGANGKILFDNAISSDKKEGFIVQQSQFNKEDLILVKCTPYINETNYEDGDTYGDANYMHFNLLGYLSAVYKVEDGIIPYVSGNDAYAKKYTTSGTTTAIDLIDVNTDEQGDIPYVESNPITKALRNGNFETTGTLFVYSAYNLNLLALTNDMGAPKGTISHKKLKFTFDSLILSSMYMLPSMYHNYVQKTYSIYTEENYTKFDNTIRSSKLQGDEELNFRIVFRSTDYYNMPTNKGLITKLISVGDAILVHTEDSLFKFSGSNTLSTQSGEDVQTIESEPFDTGVSEIFGSQNGFAGLQDNKSCCVSQAGYMFYDKSANTIYYYTSGQEGGLKIISDDIHKLINLYTVSRIRFADDFENNRIFVSIRFVNAKDVTLSFNTITKSFISLHDFAFEKSFSTKSKCYFWKTAGTTVYKIDNNTVGYSVFTFNDTIYPYKNDDVTDTNKQSIVDVIYNVNYQRIKTLNYINYICSAITSFAKTWNVNNADSLCVAEENLNRHYPGNYIRIYSDSCCTDLINCSNATSEANASLASRYSMIKPIYNQGAWSLNVFRNILDNTDITQSGSPADNKSLIYGKYFIVRFVFNAGINFKLENVSFNII